MEVEQAVDPRLVEFQMQLPGFVEKLHAVFVQMMESIKEGACRTCHPDHFDPEHTELDPELLLKHWVWLLSEGEIIPLSELVTKLRDQLPSVLSEQLPLSLTAVHDMVLSACERKAYGLSSDTPKDPAAKLEAPVYPALLVWEVDTKLLGSSCQVFTSDIRQRIDKFRRQRKDLKAKLTALERLVKSIQANETVEKITAAREKWREFEKKDEKLKLIEDERLRKMAEREELVKLKDLQDSAKRAERGEMQRKKAEDELAKRAEKEEIQRRRHDEEGRPADAQASQEDRGEADKDTREAR
jgi:hypothetical protein